jgi:Pectate lyase superfamily protein
MKLQGLVRTGGKAVVSIFIIKLLATMALIIGIETSSAKADVSPITVQTIAALRAMDTSNTNTFTNDTVAYVIDYYALSTLGQRAGGHFRWVTPYSSIPTGGYAPADDGGHFIACTANTNGLWIRMLDGAIPNVKMWGAYGDGTHDDTVALNSAINAAGNYEQGIGLNMSELLFPAGLYLITNTLVFNASSLHIRGEGPQNTIVQMQYGYSADIFRTGNANSFLTGGSGGYDHGFIFEDLGLSFAAGNTNIPPARNKTNAGLVVGLPGEVSTIRNVQFWNGGIGIRCLGAGAPGLNLRDIKVNDPAIAGVSFEPLPGETLDSGGPITIIGLSGDQNYGDAATNASLVVVSNVNSLISIQSIKAESDFGGGLIHYYCGNGSIGDGTMDMGHLSLRECNYNAGYTEDGVFVQPDFLKIDPSSGFTGAGPVITIEQVNLNAVHNLIRDNIGGRIVEADVQLGTGLQQLTAKLPIVYQANVTGSGSTTAYLDTPGSSLMIGETAVTTFYATNTGWYRIMAPYGDGDGNLSGRVSITNPGLLESIELQVDCTQYQTPWINVTRCHTGVNVVSQARAISYWDPIRGGPWAFLDIYVSNAIPVAYGVGARLTVTLDTQGVQDIGAGMTQLLSPIIPVGSPPAGASVTITNTYR